MSLPRQVIKPCAIFKNLSQQESVFMLTPILYLTYLMAELRYCYARKHNET